MNLILNWDVYDIIYEEEVERTNPTFWTMTTWERYKLDCWFVGWNEVKEEIDKFMKWD